LTTVKKPTILLRMRVDYRMNETRFIKVDNVVFDGPYPADEGLLLAFRERAEEDLEIFVRTMEMRRREALRKMIFT
jgi:hypothetical protein